MLLTPHQKQVGGGGRESPSSNRLPVSTLYFELTAQMIGEEKGCLHNWQVVPNQVAEGGCESPSPGFKPE